MFKPMLPIPSASARRAREVRAGLPVSVSSLFFFPSVPNGLAVVLCVRLFLAQAHEQPILMFAAGGGDEALDPDTCFAVGREHVPKLRSVMRITSVFAKDALRHAVRDQLQRREGGAPTGNDTTLRQPNDGGVLV